MNAYFPSRLWRAVLLLIIIFPLSLCRAQAPQDGFLKLGGFCCVDLRPFANDHYFELYQVGFWSHASFRMDVWKRQGVPYWYPRNQGNVRVAGSKWTSRNLDDVVSSTANGGTAHAGSARDSNPADQANDGDPGTYWYAGDNGPGGNLRIDFKTPQLVKEVRFLGWRGGRHAPKDYTIGLKLPDGSTKVVAEVKNEKRTGQWIAFPVANITASGIYMDVASTIEGQYGPVIYEFQARGNPQRPPQAFPSGVNIPLRGQTAVEACFLGHVGGGFETTPDVETPVGNYVLVYENGQEEMVPLVAGRNVAGTRYGSFVPGAQFAWGLYDQEALVEPDAPKLFYHLGEMADVEPKKQLMVFSHTLAHKDWPLRALRFNCTDPDAFLILEGLTLRQSGLRMNVLTYNGRQLQPTPPSAPSGGPSWLEAQRDPARTIRLDGQWQYRIDPGNQGLRQSWFEPNLDATSWGKMAVPSQWYVQGLDYHGVAWFRRAFDLPAAFPGSVLELDFQRADYDARVWVNGVYVGRHTGAFSSFKLDATPAVKKGASNTIVVRVESPLDPGFANFKTLAKGNAMDDIAMPYAEEGSMGGIYCSVFLEGRGEAAVKDVWAASEVRPDWQQATVTVRCAVSSQEAVTVKCRLTEPGSQQPRVLEDKAEVAAGENTPVEFSFDIDQPMLWWPWEQGPANLHTLEIEVWRGAERLDRHVSRVGVKQVEYNAKENCLYVNGHRIFLKGMLYDDPHWESLMDRRAYRYRIQLMKDAHLNTIRLTTHQSSPEFYELCDEMGMMVWQETPLQWAYSAAERIHKDILQIVSETVRQTRPHACVIGYSAWNEGGQQGFTDEVVKLMKSLDATRPMTRACGGGDFDVHVYPTQEDSLTRCTPLWSGLKFGFISETGAYGISDLKKLKAMFGNDLFRFDGAEYFWETLASYRQVDGPAYMENPPPINWPTGQIRDYVFQRVDASERFFWQVMKSMYEVTRGQRFEPTTSCIYCRFDDAFPTAFLGTVNFAGQPLKAYEGVKEACQAVLPILRFDPLGASDLRVVNEHWFKSWTNCQLRYVLKSYDGKVVRKVERRFDLPPDSVVQVLQRDELGDLWHVPGGIKADLTIRGPDQKLLSVNHYDFTAEEVRTFVGCVYPTAPVMPLNATLLRAEKASASSGTSPVPVKGAYGSSILALQGPNPSVRFDMDVPADGVYKVRVACDCPAVAHQYELILDGMRLPLESCPSLDINASISRGAFSELNLQWRPPDSSSPPPSGAYSERNLAWYPGWDARMTKGRHELVLRWLTPAPAPKLLLDALAVQKQ
jgi:beta-mannosidase